MKPFGKLLGSQVGTHEVSPLLVCPLPVHSIKSVEPSSPSVVEPVLVFVIALKLFNKLIQQLAS